MTQATQLKQLFRSSIRRGTGEACLLMKDHPEIDFSSDIIKACLKNFAYDGQMESSRATYLNELISLSPKRNKIRNAVLKALATEREDTWTLTQLFDLAKLFAEKGDIQAKQAIYDRFLVNPINGSDWVGESEILELDGIPGLLFIADKVGRMLESDPDNWWDSLNVDEFQQKNPEMKIMDTLKKAAKHNRFIKIYLKELKQRGNHKPETIVYQNIVEEVTLSKRVYNILRIKPNDAELKQLAERLLIEKNINHQERLLMVFARFRFPLESSAILRLAKAKKAPKIPWRATRALTLLTGEEIRSFALERMKTSKYPGNFAEILKSNYREGDHVLLTNLAKKFKSEDVIENLAGSYSDIYKANKTKNCKEPLEAVYDKLNCGLGRQDIVKILMENDVLSDKIRNEIRFDCNEETR